MNDLPSTDAVFPPSQRARVVEGVLRYALLQEVPETSDELIESWIRERVGDRSDTWGPPSKSNNAIVSICRAMTTPGLYGRTPMLAGADADAMRDLTASLWTKLQHVQFLAYGLGCCAVGIDVPDSLGRPVYEIVPPHEFYVETHPDDPLLAVHWRTLRQRTVIKDGEARDVLAWDVWDIRDPQAPTFYVAEAHEGGEVGFDLTEQVTGSGPMSGDAYPWRYPDGEPFIPFVAYRNRDVGEYYNWMSGKGAFQGTLDDMLLGAYVMKAARDATGKSHIVSNVEFTGTRVRDNNGSKENSGVQVIDFEPGEVAIGTHREGTNPWAYSFGAGDMLPQLAEFRQQHRSSLAVDMGVTPTDAVRVGANPMSGAAIHLTNAQKRLEQHRLEPLYRESDREAMRKVWALAVRAGLVDADADPDVSITYHQIRRSPDEERQEREALEWSVAQGVASPVDVYLAQHPSATREQAIEELVRVARDRALIEQRIGSTPTTPEANE